MEKTKTTKAIRFKLSNSRENAKIQQIINSLNKTDFNLASFVVNLDNFIEKLKTFLYSAYSKNKKEYCINEKFTLKSEWVKNYAKFEYAALKNKIGRTATRQQYTIADYGVSEIIDEVFIKVYKIYGDLCDDATAELNERSKKAKTALLLKSLYAKNALPCLIDLVENVVDKKERGDESLQLKVLARELLAQLECGIQLYLPEQSNGMVIAKASLNYYTLNKKPIDFDKKIKEIGDRLLTQIDNHPRYNTSKKLWNAIKEDIQKRCEGKILCLGDSPFLKADTYVSLRQILKNILAKQKAAFSEMMQEGVAFEELKKSDLYLFNDIARDEFDKYKGLTDEIERLATIKNQCTNKDKIKLYQSKLAQLKKQRGSLINKRTQNLFKDYKNISAWYREVAKKHGRLLAQLKSIEKERVESQMLQYWALIAEDNNQYKLVLIPKEKAQECNRYLKVGKDLRGDVNLYWFESFTFRSLQKLCFGNLESGSNTFYQEIKRELREYTKTDKRGYPQFISGEHEFEGDEQKKIKFYQDVLKSRYANQVLRLPMRELKQSVVDTSFETLDDFKIALEKICYQRFVRVDAYAIKELIEMFDAQVFDISSSDLQYATNIGGKEYKYPHTDKAHTQIWRNFWSTNNVENHFDVRLNPELSITYRKPKESRLAKYGVGSELYDSNKKNRYLHEQLTLITTISEHANSPIINQSFASIDDVENTINKFNEKVNAQDMHFAFGIDNGEVELSTLGVYLPIYDQPTTAAKMEMLKQVDKYGFKVLTIKDLTYNELDVNGKKRLLIQNPSYFLKQELYCRTFGKNDAEFKEMFTAVFEEKYLLSIDLSTAKVISGFIITNGDVISLFNLWMKHAQRNVYEMNEHAKAEGAKRIVLKRSNELNATEKRKFIDYLNEDNKEYAKLSENDKDNYVSWIYKYWENDSFESHPIFEKVRNKHRIAGNYLYDVLMAVSFMGDEITEVSDIFNIRNIFKLRKDFYCVKSEEEILKEINSYNKRSISDEELDLKLNQMKSSLVANVIGVIDHLYHQYKERFGGEGFIAMEDFDEKKVIGDRAKFAGNIYRMLERKLYTKLLNYGLVPPMKNLLQIRYEKNLKQIGNVKFVNPEGTSQMCPVCESGRLGHTEICSNNCGFESKNIMHSNDGIAGFNIAKRGFNS